ncbi:Acetyltransferase (GNAT) family protein [Oceanobacillus limi]|uniref:Acetyltransferase (GNAT) family protein n=1 Tax=Oceanobacillus limi TaxID=930131 RepID=A0A1I0CGG2_9BACI|nr:GNAT family N-acetyltransferase [Oceanobacillus limi]SET18179.1 Acetyltransferase (GNAT) family protein [Oceanobacillus limi]
MYKATVNPPIENHEVPDLREKIGWGRRDQDYPALFKRCNFWAGIRDGDGQLIAFGYVCGMGLEHGYLEDVMVHPDYQRQGLGLELVKTLLDESKRYGLGIITVTFASHHQHFYQLCGFSPSSGGVLQLD